MVAWLLLSLLSLLLLTCCSPFQPATLPTLRSIVRTGRLHSPCQPQVIQPTNRQACRGITSLFSTVPEEADEELPELPQNDDEQEQAFVDACIEVMTIKVDNNDTAGFIKCLHDLSQGISSPLTIENQKYIKFMVLIMLKFEGLNYAEDVARTVSLLADVGLTTTYFGTLFDILLLHYRFTVNKKRVHLIPLIKGLAKAGFHWDTMGRDHPPNKIHLLQGLLDLCTDLGRVAMERKDLNDAIDRFGIPWQEELKGLRLMAYFACRMHQTLVDPKQPLLAQHDPEDFGDRMMEEIARREQLDDDEGLNL